MRGRALTPSRQARAQLAALLLTGMLTAAHAHEPQTDYNLHCMGCHTPDGSGIAGRVPPIRETLSAFSRTAQGRRFLVQVPGVAQAQLSDAELAQLLNWMIANLSAHKPRQFTPYGAREVARYRAQPLVQVSVERERLLQQMGR
jgi:cytochrome c553